jgi:hypothetical protein
MIGGDTSDIDSAIEQALNEADDIERGDGESDGPSS